MAEQLDRFRSFTERYLVERASHFEIGREQEQAWMAIQDATKIYDMIAERANIRDGARSGEGAGQAGVSSSPPMQALPNSAPVDKMLELARAFVEKGEKVPPALQRALMQAMQPPMLVVPDLSP